MNNTIQYKGYVGSIEFSEEDKIFYGKVLGIRSLISYEGENATELIDDFHQAVDDYLELCKNPVKHRKPLSREVLMYGFLLSCTKSICLCNGTSNFHEPIYRRNTCQISSSSRRSLIYMKTWRLQQTRHCCRHRHCAFTQGKKIARRISGDSAKFPVTAPAIVTEHCKCRRHRQNSRQKRKPEHKQYTQQRLCIKCPFYPALMCGTRK